MSKTQIGYLAKLYCKVELPLQVLKSAAGFYIGTFSICLFTGQSHSSYGGRYTQPTKP